MKQQIQLSDHFTNGRLLRFTLPSICMMIFTSIYGMVDGFFISNLVGKTLGENDIPRARRYFTMMMYLMLGTSVFFTILGIIILKPIAFLFGATEAMVNDVVTYGTICLIFNTALQAQYTFQSYLVTAEKPKMALGVVIAAGVTNMILDYVFMAFFRMGVAGAALATGLSECVAGIIPFVWFLSKRNQSALRFTKTKFELKPMLLACGNGASEMLSSVSGSITGILYNWQLMRWSGEDGVAAYGVVMYAAFVFLGVFNGYSQGSSPIVGYHYGAQNHKEVKNVLKRSLVMLASAAVVLTAIAITGARVLSAVFVGYDAALLDMTTRAFRICAVPFPVMWFNMYTSCFFTALNDGAVSAAISFMRSLVLPLICVIVMPAIWHLDGVWFSLVGSEMLGVFVSLYFLLSKRKKYQY